MFNIYFVHVAEVAIKNYRQTPLDTSKTAQHEEQNCLQALVLTPTNEKEMQEII